MRRATIHVLGPVTHARAFAAYVQMEHVAVRYRHRSGLAGGLVFHHGAEIDGDRD